MSRFPRLMAAALLGTACLLGACSTNNDTDQISTESPTTRNSTADADSTGHDEAHDDD